MLRLQFLVLGLACALAAPGRGQEVSLPLEDFDALRRRAEPPAASQRRPPAPFALEDATLRVDAASSGARVETELSLALYSPDWQRVPLPGQERVIDFDLNGLEGRFDAESGALVVRGSGRHRVRLVYAVAVELEESRSRPTWKLAFQVPDAGVVRGVVVTDGTDGEVDSVGLSGEALATGPTEDGQTPFVARSGGEVRLLLQGEARAPERDLLPLRFDARSFSRAALSRTGTRVEGHVEVRVHQGLLHEIRLPLPPGLEVVGLDESRLAGWDVVDDSLVLTLLEPLRGTLAVAVRLRGEPVTELAAPVLEVPGALHSRLYSAVRVDADGVLQLVAPSSGRGVDLAEEWPHLHGQDSQPERAQGFVMQVSDPRRPPQWEVIWAEDSDVLATRVDRLLVDTLVGRDGRGGYQLWAQVTNRGGQELTLTLPPGFDLVRARRNDEEVAPGRRGTQLAVPLVATEQPQVVYIQGLFELAPGASGDRLTLPLPRLSAPVTRIEVRAILAGGKSYSLVEGARRGSVRLPLPSGAELYQRLPGFHQVEAAWNALSPEPTPLVLETRRRKERSKWF